VRAAPVPVFFDSVADMVKMSNIGNWKNSELQEVCFLPAKR